MSVSPEMILLASDCALSNVERRKFAQNVGEPMGAPSTRRPSVTSYGCSTLLESGLRE